MSAVALIEKDRATSAAAEKLALPAWDAVTIQLPAPTILIVAPFVPPAAQTPAGPAIKVIGLPEAPPVMVIVNGGSPTFWFAKVPNIIVWLACAIVTFCWVEAETRLAVAVLVARTTHVPAPVELKVPAAALTSVHGPLTWLYVIVNPPGLVVAFTVKLPLRKLGVGAAPNVTVGVPCPIGTFRVFVPAVKVPIAGTLARTTQVPAPVAANTPPEALTKAHGPLSAL